MMDEDGTTNWLEESIDNDISIIVELAALMLDGDVDEIYNRALAFPVVITPSIISLGATIVAQLAERLALAEGRSPEEILLELRLEDDYG